MAFFVSAARRIFFQASMLIQRAHPSAPFLLLEPLVLFWSQVSLGQGPPRNRMVLLRSPENRRLRTDRSWGSQNPVQFWSSQFRVPVLTFVFWMFVSNLTTREGLLRAAIPDASIPGNLLSGRILCLGREQSPRRRSFPRCQSLYLPALCPRLCHHHCLLES